MFHEYYVPQDYQQACPAGATYAVEAQLPDSLILKPCEGVGSLSANDVTMRLDRYFPGWSLDKDSLLAPVITEENGKLKVYTGNGGEVVVWVDLYDGSEIKIPLDQDTFMMIINNNPQDQIPVAPVQIAPKVNEPNKPKRPIDKADIFGVAAVIGLVYAFRRFVIWDDKVKMERIREKREYEEEKQENGKRFAESEKRKELEDHRKGILYNGFDSVNKELSVLEEEIRRLSRKITDSPSYSSDEIPAWRTTLISKLVQSAKLHSLNENRHRLVNKFDEKTILEVEVDLPDGVVTGIVDAVNRMSGKSNNDNLGWLYDINRTLRVGGAVHKALNRQKRKSSRNGR